MIVKSGDDRARGVLLQVVCGTMAGDYDYDHIVAGGEAELAAQLEINWQQLSV